MSEEQRIVALRFLARMGATPGLRYLRRARLHAELVGVGIAADLSWAMAGGDAARVALLLGIQERYRCDLLPYNAESDPVAPVRRETTGSG